MVIIKKSTKKLGIRETLIVLWGSIKQQAHSL
jgi:hypothetical protein